MTLKSLLLSILIFSQPLFAEINPDVDSTIHGVLVETDPAESRFFIKTKNHFFTLTHDHILQILLYRQETNDIESSDLHNTKLVSRDIPFARKALVDGTPIDGSLLPESQRTMVYPFKLSFTLNYTHQTRDIECYFDIVIANPKSTDINLITSRICATDNGFKYLYLPLFSSNFMTHKELGIKVFLFKSEFEDNTPEFIILKVGGDNPNLYFTLTSDQIYQIFYSNGITQIDSISGLELIESPHNKRRTHSFDFTLSFYGHFTKNAPHIDDNKIQCKLRVNLSDKRIILRDCINSELRIIEEFSYSGRSFHSSSFEDLGIPKHTPRKEVN